MEVEWNKGYMDFQNKDAMSDNQYGYDPKSDYMGMAGGLVNITEGLIAGDNVSNAQRSGSIGQGIGMGVGSFFGPVGTAVGGAVGQLAGNLIGKKKDTEIRKRNAGIMGAKQDINYNAYEDISRARAL